MGEARVQEGLERGRQSWERREGQSQVPPLPGRKQAQAWEQSTQRSVAASSGKSGEKIRIMAIS